MSAACNATLGPAEWLEVILLQVDNSSLLRCLRVSKTWQQAIDSSKTMQQKLFFQPADPEKLVAAYEDMAEHLKPTTKFGCDEVFQSIFYPQTLKDSIKTCQLLINPLVRKMFKLPTRVQWAKLCRKDLQPQVRPDASHRKMAISRPPVLRVSVRTEKPSEFLKFSDASFDGDAAGFTVGNLFDRLYGS